MKFGDIIKELRRKKDITQEQLAEILSVSSQAVSRWETNTALPDISMLPVLANYFDVTIDYLLQVDIAKKRERINAICEDIIKFDGEEVADEKYYSGAIEKARAALKLYPDSGRIKLLLAEKLGNIMYYCKDDPKLKKEYGDELNAICENVIRTSQSECEKREAIAHICYNAKETGNKERAKELCCYIPEEKFSYERMMLHILDGEEYEKEAKKELSRARCLIEDLLYNLGKNKSPEKMSEYFEKIRELKKLLYDNDNCVKSAFDFWDMEYRFASAFAECGAYDEAFDCLERSFEKYEYGAENGYSDFSELHDEYERFELTHFYSTPAKIRGNCRYKIRNMLADIEAAFPEEFLRDERYVKIKGKFEAFFEKCNVTDAC